MPRTITPRPYETGLPEPSQARLTAEAAFSQGRTRHDGDTEPVVVVKRQRTIDASANGAPIVTEASHPTGEVRASKVFRIESVAVAIGNAEDADNFNETNDGISTPAHPVEAGSSGARIPRKRRRAQHGSVTVFHPQPTPVIKIASQKGKQPLAGQASRRSEQHATAFDASTLKRGNLGQYEVVRAEIEKLERIAEKLKKGEAAKAVRWIRKVMADFGITEGDLDF